MIENEKLDLTELFEEWVRLTRLSGGVRDAADVASTRKGALDLCVRMAEPFGPPGGFVNTAADILWAQMIPLANGPADPRHVALGPMGNDPSEMFGALARAQPPGPVRDQLYKLAGMQPQVFQAGIATLASLRT